MFFPTMRGGSSSSKKSRQLSARSSQCCHLRRRARTPTSLKYWALSLKLCPKPLTAAPVLKRLAEVLEYSGDAATDAFGDDERPADGEQAPRGPLQKVTVSGAGFPAANGEYVRSSELLRNPGGATPGFMLGPTPEVPRDGPPLCMVKISNPLFKGWAIVPVDAFNEWRDIAEPLDLESPNPVSPAEEAAASGALQSAIIYRRACRWTTSRRSKERGRWAPPATARFRLGRPVERGADRDAAAGDVGGAPARPLDHRDVVRRQPPRHLPDAERAAVCRPRRRRRRDLAAAPR